MSERSLNTRIQNKCDITANWEKATNFVPKKGEIIIYSDGGGVGIPKMKVGDGTTKVGSLEFISATVPDASVSISGIVNTGEQTFGGNKTFRGFLRVTNNMGIPPCVALGVANSSLNYLFLQRSSLDFGKISDDTGSSRSAGLTFSPRMIECYGNFVSYNDSWLGQADKPWPGAYITNLYGNADTATTASSVSNALSINGKSFDGSAAVDVGVIGAEYGGSGKTTLEESAFAFLKALPETVYAPQDDAWVVLRNSAVPITYFWYYIKNKADSVYQPAGTYLTSLPIASSSTLGGVKIGSGLTVAEDGTISAAAQYTLPTASSSVKGGIKVGTGLTMSSETLNHSNSVTAKTAYGSTATTASANGGSITVTDIKYDAQGHITGSTDRTITLSQTTYTLAGLMGSAAKGSETQPVYWNGSAWTNTTYTLGKSVPADAKFTDTVYTLPTASSTLGGVKTTSTVSATTGLTACPIIDGVVYYKDTNNTYTLAGLVGSTAIGTATNPIYWDGAKFVKTTYTLGKSVPADAKFTDTVYTLPTASSSVLGGIKLGTGLTAAADGTVNVSVGGATITLKTWTDADVA